MEKYPATMTDKYERQKNKKEKRHSTCREPTICKKICGFIEIVPLSQLILIQ
jgi:hypothetical protein